MQRREGLQKVALVAVIATSALVLLVIGMIAWVRKDRSLLVMAIAATLLLAVQIVLGALTVLWKLPPQIIMAHLALALAIFAVVITIAVLSGKPAPSKELPAKTRKFAQLAISNALLVYILMLLGSYVTGSQAALACSGWPFCTPAAGTGGTALADINILHRVCAVFVGLVTFWTVIAALTVFVNLLSAVLAFSAILFYVFVYTLGLKRNYHAEYCDRRRGGRGAGAGRLGSHHQ
jgi:protoheme IX farnesyltransferase